MRFDEAVCIGWAQLVEVVGLRVVAESKCGDGRGDDGVAPGARYGRKTWYKTAI